MCDKPKQYPEVTKEIDGKIFEEDMFRIPIDSKHTDNFHPPRSAHDLLMEKQRLHPDITIWFTEDVCPVCKKDIYTDGKTRWCSPDCRVPGTYSKLQEDYIR